MITGDRRRNPLGAQNQIKEMRARHEQIIRLDAAGVNNIIIAQIMGLSPQSISIIKNSAVYRSAFEKFKARLDDRVIEDTANIRKRIEELSGKSVTVLEEILDDALADDKVKADVAFDILDRAGHGATQKVEHSFNFGDVVKNAYNRRKERIKASEATVDITPQDDISEGEDTTKQDEVKQLDDFSANSDRTTGTC